MIVVCQVLLLWILEPINLRSLVSACRLNSETTRLKGLAPKQTELLASKAFGKMKAFTLTVDYTAKVFQVRTDDSWLVQKIPGWELLELLIRP